MSPSRLHPPRALAALPRQRGHAFRPWLFAIARNVVADSFRNGRVALPIEAAGDLRAIGPGPDDAVIANDDHAALDRMLSQLSPDQRVVVELRLSGLTGVEIAQALGKRPGAVRALQFRAFQRLRDELKQGSDQ